MSGRCRICTANDRDALVEEIAAAVWKREVRSPWHETSVYWRTAFREHVETMLTVLEERRHDEL